MPARAEKVKNADEDPLIHLGDESSDKGRDKSDSIKSDKKDKQGEKEPIDQAKVDRAVSQVRQIMGANEGSGQTQALRERSAQKTVQLKPSSEGQIEVQKSSDGKYFVSNVASFDKESLQSIFKKYGIGVDIKFPKDWSAQSITQKRTWLRAQGVEVIPALAGGNGEEEGENWLDELPDSSEVSSDLANYVREIERIGKGARSSEDKHSALQNIDENLTAAVLRGEISADSASVDLVQEALSQGLAETGRDFIRSARREDLVGGGRRKVSTFARDEEFEVPAKSAVDKLLELAGEGKTSGVEWSEALKKAQDRVFELKKLAESAEPKDYKKAHYIAKGIHDAIVLHPESFSEKLPEVVRSELELAEVHLKTLDDKFQTLLNRKSKQEQHALVGDIDSDAALYLKQITAGWGVSIDEAKTLILQRAAGEDHTGIREWRALKSIESLDEAIRVKQLTETPVIWKEVPEKLASVYTQMESMDFTVEELQVVTNEAIQLVRSITPDNPAGRDMRDKLVDQLEAFRGFHSMRITMERKDMDPEGMVEIFQTYFKDDTWQHFVERFSKDSKSREFTDAAGDESNNLFDISFSLYSEKLRQERIKMNMVEEITKHAIENSFSDGTIHEIEKGMRITLTDEQKADLENLRQYFVEKTELAIDKNDAISGKSVDEIWGRKRNINGVDCINDVTHKVIETWHQKETLQGAFGLVKEEDLDDIYKHFGVDTSDAAAVSEARNKYLNKTFLQVRRGEMQDALAKEIIDQDVHVKFADGSTKKVDLAELRQSGFLNSVDSNAYYTTWMFQWSNYESIRIYSRDTKSNLDDDFESLVIHGSTNLYYGRHIDHIWEFYHDTNENRGRPKENDVNRLWKQHLPGKHHYLFPQNSLMVRWTKHFMNDEQKATLKRRTEQMMREWDFDNEKYHGEYVGWMENAAMMDMIESGEVSMSSADNNVTFSKVMKQSKLRKFEMIDVFADRGKHKKYVGTDTLQAYLANPTEQRFIELNDKTKTFYSTRGARQFPFMTLATRAHWDVSNNHRMRLFDVPNATSTEMEGTLEILRARGDMERKQVEHEKRKFFGFKELRIGGKLGVPKIADFEVGGPLGSLMGTTPFRRTRQMFEFGRKSAWDAKHVPVVLPFIALFGAVWGGFTEFLKQSVKQASGQR